MQSDTVSSSTNTFINDLTQVKYLLITRLSAHYLGYFVILTLNIGQDFA